MTSLLRSINDGENPIICCNEGVLPIPCRNVDENVPRGDRILDPLCERGLHGKRCPPHSNQTCELFPLQRRECWNRLLFLHVMPSL